MVEQTYRDFSVETFEVGRDWFAASIASHSSSTESSFTISTSERLGPLLILHSKMPVALSIGCALRRVRTSITAYYPLLSNAPAVRLRVPVRCASLKVKK